MLKFNKINNKLKPQKVVTIAMDSFVYLFDIYELAKEKEKSLWHDAWHMAIRFIALLTWLPCYRRPYRQPCQLKK